MTPIIINPLLSRVNTIIIITTYLYRLFKYLFPLKQAQLLLASYILVILSIHRPSSDNRLCSLFRLYFIIFLVLIMLTWEFYLVVVFWNAKLIPAINVVSIHTSTTLVPVCRPFLWPDSGYDWLNRTVLVVSAFPTWLEIHLSKFFCALPDWRLK